MKNIFGWNKKITTPLQRNKKLKHNNAFTAE